MMTSQAKARQPFGFTLIELLVVVAIIALLISILLPSLSKARDTARMVKCQAILKQMGTAHHMYANEADDWFVPVITGGRVFAFWVHNLKWRTMMGMAPPAGTTPAQLSLAPYPDGLVCPNVPPDGRFGNPFFNYGWNYTSHVTDGIFVENNMPFREGDYVPTGTASAVGPLRRAFRSRIKNPSSKLHTTDASNIVIGVTNADWSIRWDVAPETKPGYPEYGPGFGDQTSYRHNEGGNLLMYDAHVEYQPKAEVFSFNPNNTVNNAKNRALWYLYF